MLLEDYYSAKSSVLVVLNSNISTSVVRDSAKQIGLTDIVVAQSVARGIELLKDRSKPFDLVVVGETVKRRYDGYQLIKIAKEKYLRGGVVGLVLVTQMSEDNDSQYYQRMGLDGHVRLPSNTKSVIDVFKQILNIKAILAPIYLSLNSGLHDRAYEECRELLYAEKKLVYRLAAKRLYVDICNQLGFFKESFNTAKQAYSVKEEEWSYVAMMRTSLHLTPPEKTRKILEQMAKHRFGWYDGNLLLAEMHIERQDYKAALRRLLKVQEVKGVDIQLTQMVAEIARLAGNYREHVKALRRLVTDTQNTCFSNPKYCLDLAMSMLTYAEDAFEDKRFVANTSQAFYLQYLRELKSNPSRFIDKLFEAKSNLLRRNNDVANSIADTLYEEKDNYASIAGSDRLFDFSQVLEQLGRNEEASNVVKMAVDELEDDSKLSAVKYRAMQQADEKYQGNDTSAEAINRKAIQMFTSGQIKIAMDMFLVAQHAMPDNVNVAINLLCAVAKNGIEQDARWKFNTVIGDCMTVVKKSTLTAKQAKRYEFALKSLQENSCEMA